jgi:hypothetical protein
MYKPSMLAKLKKELAELQSRWSQNTDEFSRQRNTDHIRSAFKNT